MRLSAILTIAVSVILSINALGQAEGRPVASPSPTPEPTPISRWSGSYQGTFNTSLLGSPKPSMGHRLNLSYAPKFGGSFDSRFEYYNDGSYNADPPGLLLHNINEPKFEGQLNYTRPLIKRLSWTVGLLYHHNFRFQDDYFWWLTGIVYTQPLGKRVTVTLAPGFDKKADKGPLFFDGTAFLEYRFIDKWNAQVTIHRYQNQGQLDQLPTPKLEMEFGVNRLLKHKQLIGASVFRHIQLGHSPNDQFTFFKLKYSVGF
jgi:hypothetical protein